MQPHLNILALNELSRQAELNHSRIPQWRLKPHGKRGHWQEFTSLFSPDTPMHYWRR